MGIMFEDDYFDGFALRALTPALYGGADFGECFTTAKRITSGDVDSWHREWTATPVVAAIQASPILRWSLIQRGLWVHGVDTLAEYFRILPQYSVADHVADIRCPTLLTLAENEPRAQGAVRLYDALTCAKALYRFTAAAGAGDHCEALARSLYCQRAFDWLDETLRPAAAP
jgi:hypothetical protein